MRVAHHNKDFLSGADLLTKAVHHEREGEFDATVKTYHKFLKQHPHSVEIYDKIMRIHRDLKEYEKELAVIDKAIKVFEKYHKDLKPVYNKTVTMLSKKLLKATGLADEKGRNVYQPAEIARWKKRRNTVRKRLGLPD